MTRARPASRPKRIEGPAEPAAGALGEDFIAFDADDDAEVDSPQPDASTREPVAVDDTIREHASARSTPWALHVPWHKCRNVSEMCVMHGLQQAP